MFCPTLNIWIEKCYVSELGSQSSSCPHCWSLLGPWLCQLPDPTPGFMAFECLLTDSRLTDFCATGFAKYIILRVLIKIWFIRQGKQFSNFTTSLKTGDWYLHIQPHPLPWPRKHKNSWRVARYHRQVISNPPKWKMCTYFRFPGWSRELQMGTRHWRKSQGVSEEDDWQNVDHSGKYVKRTFCAAFEWRASVNYFLWYW